MDTNTREALRHLVSTSGTMAGLCITAATVFATLRTTSSPTIVDDIFVLSALLFLVCTYCIFWALRASHVHTMRMLRRVTDVLFAIALTAMVAAGFVMTYMLW